MIHPIVAGGLGGLIATVPMSIVMKSVERLLPWRQQYALPPEQITVETAERLGVAHELDRWEKKAASVVNHFGFGTAMGVAYGCFSLAVTPTVLGGVAFGLGVWSVSYLVGLPLLRMRAAAPRQPQGRNVMMVASHVVWGAVLGAFTAWAVSP